MNLFYSEYIDVSDEEIIFLDQENRHLTSVLRKNIGDSVSVTNGRGFIFNCILTEINKNKSVLKVVDYTKSINNSPKLKIAISLTKKSDRFEWFLEKATEIGISEITPIIAQNSVRTRLNHLRAKKILVTAMKQSLRDVLPTLNSPIKLSSYLDSIDSSLDSFIATCLIDDIDLLSNRLTKGNNSQILIGPEGGFTQNELDLAKKANFTPVSLSDNRLRTETAGVVSCSIFSIIN